MADERSHSHHEVSADSLRGRKVIDNTGRDFGQVEDLAVDPQHWQITGLIVSVEKDAAERLHLKRPFMGNARIQVGTDRIESMGDNVLLNIGMGDIASYLQEHPGH